VYSTFLQRSYDMLLHDVALMNLHVVFAVDRAGLVGADGETHQGIYDVGFLQTVPNMKILCPASFNELREMLRHAVLSLDGPVAVRYPKSAEGRYKDGFMQNGSFPFARCLREGGDLTLVTYGVNVNTALDAADILQERGISAEIIKLNYISPIDIDTVTASLGKTGRLLVLEECAEAGCVGERIAAYLAQNAVTPSSLRLLNLGSRFVPQGSIDELREMCGIDTEGVVRAAAEACQGMHGFDSADTGAAVRSEDGHVAQDAGDAEAVEDLQDAGETEDGENAEDAETADQSNDTQVVKVMDGSGEQGT